MNIIYQYLSLLLYAPAPMFLFDKEFERKFNAEFGRLHPYLSQADCYGVSFACITIDNKVVPELRHMEYLSYRMAPLWSGWNDASDAETRLLYLFRLAYMFTEGLWCVWGAGQIIEWGGCGIDLDDLESVRDDVIREINWLLNEHRGNIRLLELNEQEMQKLAGVQYTWQYQHWVDIDS